VYLKTKKFWFGIACNTGIEIAQDKCFAFLNSNESIRTNLLFIINQLYLPNMNTIYNDVSKVSNNLEFKICKHKNMYNYSLLKKQSTV